MQRREFIGAVTATAASLCPNADEPGDKPGAPERPKETRRGDMLYRQLGSTKEEVSAIGLGGHHIGRQKDEKDSIAIIRAAIDAGITFMDNCWDYHDGGSELRMGKALRDGYRKKVFLMTKIDGRTKKAAAEQIDESLKRLQTDVIDLVQHHEVIRVEDPDRIFAEGGAQEAVEAAKKAGKVRYVGFTGHKDPLVHLRMLAVAGENGVRFDTVQMPLNLLDAHFRSFGHHVLPVLVREEIGVLGMKPLAAGKLVESGAATAEEGLRFALSLHTSVVITGMESLDRLNQALAVVKNFRPLSDSEMKALLKKTEKAAAGGEFEEFKTTPDHDSTAKHPGWLG